MDYEQIKKLIDDMGNANIDELEIEFPEGMKISMKKNNMKENKVSANFNSFKTMPVNSGNNINVENKFIEKEIEKEDSDFKIIKSPMVGTFYSKPSPDKESFTNVGENIKEGKVVCIIEAMKLMNEIESEFNGEVVEVCVKDGDVVEYGMPLFKIKQI